MNFTDKVHDYIENDEEREAGHVDTGNKTRPATGWGVTSTFWKYRSPDNP